MSDAVTSLSHGLRVALCAPGLDPDAIADPQYPVRNPAVLRYLRELLSGRWRKVIKKGSIGEVHYFEHASGQVAGVKFFSFEETS